jgi:hypothetical protein
VLIQFIENKSGAANHDDLPRAMPIRSNADMPISVFHAKNPTSITFFNFRGYKTSLR